MCQSLFFNKVAGLRPATLLKKRLWHRYFPVNFAKFLRTPFLQNIFGRLLLKRSKGLKKIWTARVGVLQFFERWLFPVEIRILYVWFKSEKSWEKLIIYIWYCSLIYFFVNYFCIIYMENKYFIDPLYAFDIIVWYIFLVHYFYIVYIGSKSFIDPLFFP